MEEDELPEGEMVTIDDEAEEPGEVRDTEDGGAMVTLGEDETSEVKEFYSNLAETLDETVMNRIATETLELIERDADARKKRDEQYEEGLRRTGMGEDAPGGASFAGASKVVHPMLIEACVDFSSRAIKELFPANGPVKDNIIGDITEEKEAKAKRKTTLMNWQLTTQCRETRAELEQLLTQLPLGGSQYLKMGWDEGRNRPSIAFWPVDDVLLPFAATNFYSSERKTFREFITKQTYQRRIKTGMYRDVDLFSPGMEPERSLSDKANDKIEGREESSYNEDGLRTVFETAMTLELEGDDKASGPAPYLVTIDKTTMKVLSIYRNWEEDDETAEEMTWAVEFPFIPWRGAYAIGLIHMIGGLAGASTGALRALLDSAHINNMPTMLKLKGAMIGGQSLSMQPTEIKEIDGGLNVDDIRKLAMPVPFNQPSPVLFQLLGFLVDAGKGVVRTALDDIAEQNPNAPVGTTLAQIEQGLVVYNAIHGRLHDAMGRFLEVLHRLNATFLDDKRIKAEVGEELAKREDFRGPKDVAPVSDPNIFSEAQRFAQVQSVAQRAQLRPDLYNGRKVEERILSTLKIVDADDLLIPAAEPTEEHSVNENVAASLGRPIVAFPDQNHIAHLKSHISFLLNPLFGQNPLIAPSFAPAMLQHFKEHLVLWYAQTAIGMAEEASGLDLDKAIKEHKDKETRQAFDAMLAETGFDALQSAQQVFDQLPQVMDMLQKMAEQFAQMNQPPADPAIAVMQAETQRKAAADQSNAQIKQTQITTTAQTAQQKTQADLQKEAMRQDREDRRSAAEQQVKLAINEADNQTALDIASAEITSGEHIAVQNGRGINP